MTNQYKILSRVLPFAVYILFLALGDYLTPLCLQFNVDENLSVRPIIYPNDVTFKTNVGLTLNYNF